MIPFITIPILKNIGGVQLNICFVLDNHVLTLINFSLPEELSILPDFGSQTQPLNHCQNIWMLFVIFLLPHQPLALEVGLALSTRFLTTLNSGTLSLHLNPFSAQNVHFNGHQSSMQPSNLPKNPLLQLFTMV